MHIIKPIRHISFKPKFEYRIETTLYDGQQKKTLTGESEISHLSGMR